MIKFIRNMQRKISIAALHLITDHRLLITAAATLPLAGCMGIYEGGFECPAGTGVGCKSISEVNQMINERELPKGSSQAHAELRDEPDKCPTCGHSFPSLEGQPEIWINPSYLKQQREQIKGVESQQEVEPQQGIEPQQKTKQRVIDV